MFPRPEVKAWRHAVREASRVPRYTAGSIRLLDYRIDYTDLCTLCPQWNDLFVREAYRFDSGNETPRILDLGANIGLASLYFKWRYPGSRITAYEADPDICEVLKRNLRANGADDVDVVNAAVWVHDEPVAFDSGTLFWSEEWGPPQLGVFANATIIESDLTSKQDRKSLPFFLRDNHGDGMQ